MFIVGDHEVSLSAKSIFRHTIRIKLEKLNVYYYNNGLPDEGKHKMHLQALLINFIKHDVSFLTFKVKKHFTKAVVRSFISKKM